MPNYAALAWHSVYLRAKCYLNFSIPKEDQILSLWIEYHCSFNWLRYRWKSHLCQMVEFSGLVGMWVQMINLAFSLWSLRGCCYGNKLMCGLIWHFPLRWGLLQTITPQYLTLLPSLQLLSRWASVRYLPPPSFLRREPLGTVSIFTGQMIFLLLDRTHTAILRPFVWDWSTRVGRYQRIHSPTHTWNVLWAVSYTHLTLPTIYSV